jgi:hypothetical protein
MRRTIQRLRQADTDLSRRAGRRRILIDSARR